MPEDVSPVLSVRDLSVSFPVDASTRAVAVEGVSFDVLPGQTVALVGESGSGKSVTALAAMGLLARPPASIDAGDIRLRTRSGREVSILQCPEHVLREHRGSDMAMIFQEPMTSLNPVLSIREQLDESLLLHQHALAKSQRTQRILQIMHDVGIPEPEQRLRQYPHQFSGGMRQRIMIAMALLCEPAVLFADEPTTALDVTVQAQVLDLISSLRQTLNLGLVLITHDLGVVAQRADLVCVLYAGRIVERAPAARLFTHPTHPYTRALLGCVPRLDGPGARGGARLETVHARMTQDAEPAHASLPAAPWWPTIEPAPAPSLHALSPNHHVLLATPA